MESDKQERTTYVNPEIGDRLRNHVLRRVRQPEHRLGKNNPRYGQQYPCDQHEDKKRGEGLLHLIKLLRPEKLWRSPPTYRFRCRSPAR